jgi:hypothetical protein
MLKLQDILDEGFEAKEIVDRIFLIENFLTQKECEYLHDLGNSSTQKDWEGAYIDNMIKFCEDKFGRKDIDNLVLEGKLEITDNWNDKILKIHGLSVAEDVNDRVAKIFNKFPEVNSRGVGIMQRQYPGTALTEHVDDHTDPSLAYATVAYINDNYRGGEVFFSKFGISFKPKAGSFLIFPTTENWTHGVTEVEPGPTRYVLPIFIRKKDFYKNNKF